MNKIVQTTKRTNDMKEIAALETETCMYSKLYDTSSTRNPKCLCNGP